MSKNGLVQMGPNDLSPSECTPTSIGDVSAGKLGESTPPIGSAEYAVIHARAVRVKLRAITNALADLQMLNPFLKGNPLYQYIWEGVDQIGQLNDILEGK